MKRQTKSFSIFLSEPLLKLWATTPNLVKKVVWQSKKGYESVAKNGVSINKVTLYRVTNAKVKKNFNLCHSLVPLYYEMKNLSDSDVQFPAVLMLS